ncbi:MSMEG_0570 family nitrogen starvation response protein [Nocardia africana]
MPEMTFDIRWPDGRVQCCYSPSLVIHDHLTAGAEYPVDEFVRRAATALNLAAERVRERFGFSCTSAMQTLADIESAAGTSPRGAVRVLTMAPPSVPAAPSGGKP